MKGFWILLSRTGKYKPYLFAAIICNILMAVFTIISIPLIIPFFQVLFDKIPDVSMVQEGGNMVDAFKSKFVELINLKGKQYALLFVCLTIVAVFFLKNIFRYLAMFFMAPIRNGIVRDIRSDLYNHYLDLPLSFHSDERKGDLISRITSDVQEMEYSILNVIEVVFKAPLLIIGSLGFMLYISPKLTLFTLVLLFFTAFVIGSIARALKRQSSEVQSRLSNINSHVEESLGGIRVVKAFRAKDYLKDKFEQDNTAYHNAINKLLRRRDLSSPLSEFLGISVVAVLLWYGSNLVFTNELLPETFFAFVFAFYNVIEPAKSFSSAYYNIQKGLAASDRIEEIMQTDNEELNQVDTIDKTLFNGSLKIDNLSFSYDQDNPVLKDINLKINKGEKIALVGASGSGKTTLVDLIVRFFEPDSGVITIDGIATNKMDRNALRKLFGIVTQDALLFNETILNNIKFNRQASIDEVNHAALIANAHDFIMQLPNGYQTNVGDQGVKLSGGQKQRITIARAILENPSILILDEATSSLDSESERMVQEALDRIMTDKTAIIIAHRLSTIKNADRIVVLEKGRIVDIGTHENLVNKEGVYKRLINMQTL